MNELQIKLFIKSHLKFNTTAISRLFICWFHKTYQDISISIEIMKFRWNPRTNQNLKNSIKSMHTKKIIHSCLCMRQYLHALVPLSIIHQVYTPQIIIYFDNVFITTSKIGYNVVQQIIHFISLKVEKILKGSLDSIPSPSSSGKIQIMGRKVCLRCKGKTLLGVVNKLLKTKSLLTMPSNVLPLHLYRP